jgi:preprotein translocase subunit SecF
MIDFVGKKQWFFLGSAIVIIIMIISLAAFKLQPGIDFSGGTSMTLSFTPQVEQNQLRQELTALGYPEAIVQRSENNFFIRIKEISPEAKEVLISGLETGFDTEILVLDYNAISPVIATHTARNAGIAVLIAAVAMLFYIVWAFRRMPSPFKWGTCAIIALIHDVLIILGIFAILGQVANVEVNAMFITAVLTIVGYSINNTVVVFDRIRENRTRGSSPDFAVTVNSSLTETLARSLNTSLTTLCVVLALLLFGGATIHYFVLALLFGLLAGTYSSLCIAGPLLVIWEKKEWSQLFPWLSFPKKAA